MGFFAIVLWGFLWLVCFGFDDVMAGFFLVLFCFLKQQNKMCKKNKYSVSARIGEEDVEFSIWLCSETDIFLPHKT